MSELAADFAHLNRARDDVASTADALERERADLERSLHSLLDGDWTGPAAGQFRAAFSEWAGGARTVLGGLHATSVLIDETRSILESQDSTVSSGMAHLHTRLS
ncbi:MAG: hypothetical protein JWO76_1855 [Nocardioides sp.]|nr:hypothetical protein [Nocardioides sp.]